MSTRTAKQPQLDCWHIRLWLYSWLLSHNKQFLCELVVVPRSCCCSGLHGAALHKHVQWAPARAVGRNHLLASANTYNSTNGPDWLALIRKLTINSRPVSSPQHFSLIFTKTPCGSAEAVVARQQKHFFSCFHSILSLQSEVQSTSSCGCQSHLTVNRHQCEHSKQHKSTYHIMLTVMLITWDCCTIHSGFDAANGIWCQ